MDHDLALGGEPAHEERVEPSERAPVEVTEIVAGRVRDVALDLDAGCLRAAGKAPLPGTVAHPAPHVEREPVEPLELGEPHARRRRAAATTPSTTCSASMPAASAEKL